MLITMLELAAHYREILLLYSASRWLHATTDLASRHARDAILLKNRRHFGTP